MSYIFASFSRSMRRWGWLAVCPLLAVCSSGSPSGTIEATNPGTVADLAVGAKTDVTVTLSFTQVDNGIGQPSSYDVRYVAGPMSWGSATSVASGTCAAPLAGTGVSGALSCTVLGLSPSTSYDFQVKAFRGTMNASAVFGGLSNVVSASTLAGPPPPPVVTTVTVAPPSASIVAGTTTTLQATVKDQNGNGMTGQTVTWSTSNAVAATVNSTGVVSGVAAGSATITATSSGKSGTSAITVTAVAPVVTTVTVAPTSASIVAGATTTLQATVKDQSGNAMTGQTVTWSTSNAAAATVNSTGVVSGVAAGSATITATSSGKTGTSAITVTAASGSGTLLFQENFEDANLASRGWYDNTNVQLSTVEHIAGSNSSAQYHFLPGATSPTSGGTQRHKFTPSNSFYVSFYVKYSTNWVGSGQTYHPHEFYTLSTLDGDYDGPSNNFLDVYVEHNYQNGGRPRIEIQDNKSVNYSYGALPNNLIAVTETRSAGGCNGVVETNIYSECFNFGTYWYNDKQLTGPVVFQPNPGPGYKNDWNFVEAYFQLNTIVNGVGQADGVVQYWFNGTLIFDRHDILFRTGAHPTLQFSQFVIGQYIGDGSPVDQSIWLDNLRIATSRIP
jgi:uncharacterized protein YjdB